MKGGRCEVQEGGDTCIPVTDPCWCMAETNSILQNNCPPIKEIIKKKRGLKRRDLEDESRLDFRLMEYWGQGRGASREGRVRF